MAPEEMREHFGEMVQATLNFSKPWRIATRVLAVMLILSKMAWLAFTIMN